VAERKYFIMEKCGILKSEVWKSLLKYFITNVQYISFIHFLAVNIKAQSKYLSDDRA
jgi:hypothetical protein